MGNTALTWAVRRGLEEVIKELLKRMDGMDTVLSALARDGRRTVARPNLHPGRTAGCCPECIALAGMWNDSYCRHGPCLQLVLFTSRLEPSPDLGSSL